MFEEPVINEDTRETVKRDAAPATVNVVPADDRVELLTVRVPEVMVPT